MAGRGRSTPTNSSGRDALLPRDETGVPGLDRVLGGGLLRGSLTVISGPPGSGKTILANQIAFAAARAGRRALVFTAFSESPSKILSHLRLFRFVDPEMIGNAIKYLSLEGALNEGLDATVHEMTDTARRQHANLVVLDGFSGLRGAAPTTQETRHFLYTLGGQLSHLGMTCLLTNEAYPRDSSQYSEATTADVLLGLYFALAGVRQQRGLEVIKMRGAAPMPGLHSLQLSDGGMTVFPLFETRVIADAGGAQTDGPGNDAATTRPDSDTSVEITPAGPVGQERAAFGLPELDSLLRGGLTRGTSTVLAGRQGTGKSLLGLRFALNGVRAGEQTVYLGFRESHRQLLAKADAFTLGPAWRAATAPGGGLTLIRWNPIQLNADVLADQLLATLERTQARRLVVDSILEVERAVAESSDAIRVEGYMAALATALQQRDVTALLIRETRTLYGADPDDTADQLAVLADNVLLLLRVRYRSAQHRLLSVVKMRFSPHDSSVREFTIATPDGIRVLALHESDSGLLSAFGPTAETGEQE